MKKKILLMALVMGFSSIVSICSFADTNFAYSQYWNMDAANNWHYTLANGQAVTDAWIQDEVSGDWYLIDSMGNMKSGIVTSNGKYYLLDNTRGTGHFGKLLKNGDIYNGITIIADTSASYQGALSDTTLNQLAQMGLSTYTAENVTGTKRVSNGNILSGGSSSSTAMTGNKVSGQTLTQVNTAQNSSALYPDETGVAVVNIYDQYAGIYRGAVTLAGVNGPNQTYTKGYSFKNQAGDYCSLPDSIVSKNGVNLLDYHTRKPLSQSEIALLASEFNIPEASYDGETVFEPYSSNRKALMNFIDYNYTLTLAGDLVDVMGNYDVAAYGHVNWGGVASLSHVLQH